MVRAVVYFSCLFSTLKSSSWQQQNIHETTTLSLNLCSSASAVGCLVSCCGWAAEADHSPTWLPDGRTTRCCAGTVINFYCKASCGVCSYIPWDPLSFPLLSSLFPESGLGGRVNPWSHSEGGPGQLHRGWAGHPPRPRRCGCSRHLESRVGVTRRAELI